MRKLIPILALLACLLWSVEAKAQDNAGCAATSTHCTITSTATNGTIVVIVQVTTTTTSVPTDGQTNTYHPLTSGGTGTSGECLTETTSFGGTNLLCGYYANTGAHSGSNVVTGQAAVNQIVAHFSPSTDMTNSGNPLDKNCQVHQIFAAGASTVTSCSLQSTQTNDIWFYAAENDAAAGCSFNSISGTSNGPSTQAIFNVACYTVFINYNQTTGANIPSGAPQTVTLNFNTVNTSGGNANANFYLITLKSGNTGGAIKHRSELTDYHPPEKFTPVLLYTILRNWIKEAYEGRA